MIALSFGERIRLPQRLAALDGHWSPGLSPEYARERAEAILHPYQTVGRERYNRVASALALEPRDPFLDRRVVEICLRLPGGQKLDRGWPKAVLRRAMVNRLPNTVRWRPGKEHLGWSFTEALMGRMEDRLRSALDDAWDSLAWYLDLNAVRAVRCDFLEDADHAGSPDVYDAAHLADWLQRQRTRPKAP